MPAIETDTLERITASLADLTDGIKEARKRVLELTLERSKLYKQSAPIRKEAKAHAKLSQAMVAKQPPLINKYKDGGEWLFDDLIKSLCIDHGVSTDSVFNNRRGQPQVMIRQYLYWLLRLNGVTWRKAGEMLGGKDHATAIYGFNTFNCLCDQNTPHRNIVRKYGFIKFKDGFNANQSN